MPPATNVPAPRDDSGEHGLLGGLAEVVERIDESIPDEAGPAAAVPVATSRYLPWVGVLFAVCCVLLVPWIVYIAVTLPHRALSPNYHVAWAGFDVMLLAALAATAVTVLRRSKWIAMSAGWTAGLLVTDAWFDTVTSPPSELWQALLLGLVTELPLAAVCVWTARHATDISERRIRVLLRRRATRDRPVRTAAADPVEAVLAAERETLSPACRADPTRLGTFLADDFREVGASGRILLRDGTPEQVAAATDLTAPPIRVDDLRGTLLSPGLVLVTYSAETAGRASHRTSLWRRSPSGAWQMFHHQGTPRHDA